MGSSSPQPQTQTTTHTLAPEQRELLNLAMPGLREFSKMEASQAIPGFSGVAGFDPSQTSGQEMVLASTPGQQGVVGSAAGANQLLTGGNLLYPESNPALQRTIEAGTRPITEQLLFNAMPVIRNQALSAGQFGGSRQGIAEGLAIQGAERAVGDTAAKIATPAYTAGLEAMTKGVGLAPQTAQSLALPGITTSGVGDVRQALAQSMLGEQLSRFNTSALWPLLQGKELASLVGGIPGGSTTTTASGPTAPSGLQQALGYGSMGVSALSSMLPLLMMSDRRTKRIIAKLSETLRGIPLYLFEYIGSSLPQVGVMADEVPAYARVRVNDIDFVDYGAL